MVHKGAVRRAQQEITLETCLKCLGSEYTRKVSPDVCDKCRGEAVAGGEGTALVFTARILKTLHLKMVSITNGTHVQSYYLVVNLMVSSTDQLACEHISPGRVTVSILKGILILSRPIYSCTVIHKVFFTSVKLHSVVRLRKYIHLEQVGHGLFMNYIGTLKKVRTGARYFSGWAWFDIKKITNQYRVAKAHFYSVSLHTTRTLAFSVFSFIK